MTVLIIIGIIIGLLVLLWYRTRENNPLVKRVNKITYKQTRDSGLTLWAEPGVIVTPEQIAAITIGLLVVIERARCRGHIITLSDYVVAILTADEIVDNVPVLRQSSKSYKGTEYDHNGFMHVGGEFIKPNIIIVPEHKDNFQNLASVVTHEATHKFYFDTDKVKYDQTQIHITEENFELPPCQ